MKVWINFLALLPGTLITVLAIGIAFLRFYDERDFSFLGVINDPRVWSNRLTVAALLAALANFSVEWNRRNRETDRLAQAEQRRITEEQRRVAAEEREAHRTRIEVARDLALLRFLTAPTAENQQSLAQVLALLQEYGDSL